MLWLIVGIGIGLGLFVILSRVKAGKLSVKWYQWTLGIIALLMILFTIQNFLGFLEELEPQAGTFILLSVGLPAVILVALIWVIPYISHSQKKKSSSKQVTSSL